jgi:Zn-finger protein
MLGDDSPWKNYPTPSTWQCKTVHLVHGKPPMVSVISEISAEQKG